ncbi:MAG: alpha-amylase/4-alpha-glucanotransferase domain-containing protein [Gemmatimonadales bacterium]
MTAPLRFVFGLHLHQPVGNFDHVFAQHVRDVYRPFLERATAAGFFPLTLHISGPLLEWLEAHESSLLDAVGRLAGDGRVELLLSGFDEPILAALPRADRVEQIERMRAWLARRFGPAATGGGLWLTERVWQPELAADLADAGVAYTLVDDHHFRVSGFRRDELHAPYRTEADGRGVALLAIDERLRYLIPFRPPEETAAYLREVRAAGHPLAVLADDGEKFGGWPGTHRWVYEEGWLEAFFRQLEQLIAGGEVALTTGATAVREVAGAGLAYLGSASYREMETWALPAAAQQELHRLQERGEATPFARGGHWPHFLVKYREANRMHKTMVALSALARRLGDPPEARRAIGRAQCNDAYWHGVFGGLYLPHLRHAIWHHLALAERVLRQGDALACETVDIDQDGFAELWVHSAHFSAWISPRRGGAIETLVRFRELENLADALTRRRESYHETALAQTAGAGGDGAGGREGREGTPSIHDIEKQARITRLPPTDTEPRALLVDRLLPASLTAADYEAGAYAPLRSWADVAMTAAVETDGEAAVIVLRGAGLEKRLRFTATGCLDAAYRWDDSLGPADALFAPELSLSREWPLNVRPAADVWTYAITTLARSERGFEETVQGTAVTPRWPVRLGACGLELGLAGPP